MAMAPPVSAKATLVARKKRPSVVSSSNGLQLTYEKRPGTLFRAGRTTSWYVVALNRRSSSGLAPLGDGTKAAVFRARPAVPPRSTNVRKMRMLASRAQRRDSRRGLDCIGICIFRQKWYQREWSGVKASGRITDGQRQHVGHARLLDYDSPRARGS